MPRSLENQSPRKTSRGRRNRQQRSGDSLSSLQPPSPNSPQPPGDTQDQASSSSRNEATQERQDVSQTAEASQSPEEEAAVAVTLEEYKKQKAHLVNLVRMTAELTQLRDEEIRKAGKQKAKKVEVAKKDLTACLDERVPPTTHHEYPDLFTTPDSDIDRTRSASSSGRARHASRSGRARHASRSGRTRPASIADRPKLATIADRPIFASNVNRSNLAANPDRATTAPNTASSTLAPISDQNLLENVQLAISGQNLLENFQLAISGQNLENCQLAITGQKLSENVQLALALAESLSQSASSTSQTSIELNSPFDDIAETRLFNSDDLEQSFHLMLDIKLSAMVGYKYYTTIDIIDSELSFVESLLSLVLEVHYSLPGVVPAARILFANQLLEISGYDSLVALEMALFSHKAFRAAIRNYFCIVRHVELFSLNQSSTSQSGSETGNVAQKSLIDELNMNPDGANNSDGQRDENELRGITTSLQRDENELRGITTSLQRDENELRGITTSLQRDENELRGITTSLQSFQPFLGDSSVRPKIQQPKKDDAKSQKKKRKDKEQNNNTTSVRNPDSPPRDEKSSYLVTPTVEASSSESQNPNEYSEHVEPTACPEMTSPRTTQHPENDPCPAETNQATPMPAELSALASNWHGDLEFFYEELDLMIEETIEKKDYDYLTLLEILKYNFRLSDVVLDVYLQSSEAQSNASATVQDKQGHDFMTDSSNSNATESSSLSLGTDSSSHSRATDSEHPHLFSNPAASTGITDTKLGSDQTSMDFDRTYSDVRDSNVASIADVRDSNVRDSNVRDSNVRDSNVSSISDVRDSNVPSISDVRDSNVSSISDVRDSNVPSISDVRDSNVSSISDVRDSIVRDSNVRDSNVRDSNVPSISDVRDSNVSSISDVRDSNVSSISDVRDSNVPSISDVRDSNVPSISDVRDSNVRDSNVRDSNVRDSNARDSNVRDSNVRDSNVRDSNVRDSNVRDSNVRDSNVRDSNVPSISDVRDSNVPSISDVRDSNVRDSNVRDSNVRDSNVASIPDVGDSNVRDSNVRDSNVRDSNVASIPDVGDSNVRDSNVRDSNVRDSNVPSISDVRDSNVRDSNVRDSNVRDSNVASIPDVGDLNVRDSNVASISDVRDSNVRDSNVRDSNVRDSNVRDSNVRDSNVRDSNVRDSNVRDSNVASISDLASSDTETWQSKVRDYYKSRMSNHLADQLLPKPKATTLKDEHCSVCCKIYRWPHLLDCFHKFCFPCVVKFYDEERKCFKCPHCSRLTTPMPPKHGAQSLLVDSRFASEMFEANLNPFCCTLCPGNEDAIKFCKDCQEYMCRDCCLAHNKNAATSGHNLEKSDMKVGAAPDGELLLMCPNDAGNRIHKYCATCRIAVCPVCVKKHSSHDLQELEDAIGAVREMINTIIVGYTEMHSGYQTVLMSLNEAKQHLYSLLKSQRRKINEFSEALIQQVEAMRRRAHIQQEYATDMVSAQAVQQQSKLEICRQNLKVYNEFVSRYLDMEAKDQVVNMFTLLEKRYFQLAQECSNLRGQLFGDVKFDPHYAEVTNAIQEAYSSIRSDYTNPLTPSLNSPLVRERHHVEPYKPLPYSLDYRFESENAAKESRERQQAAAGAGLNKESRERKRAAAGAGLTKESRERQQAAAVAGLTKESRERQQAAAGAGLTKESRERQQAAAGAELNTNNAEDLEQFSRTTLPDNGAFGRYGRGDYEFAEPSGVLYLHDCSLAVCDTRNHRIVVYNPDGTYQRTIGQQRRIPDLPQFAEEIDRTFQRTEGKLYFPYRLAQCLDTKNIVVVERPPNPGVQLFTFDGQFVRGFGGTYLQNPRGVAVDERGLIFVIESKTMNFFIFAQDGNLINRSILGTLTFPNDVVARNGMIYISDNRLHCVKCYDYSLNYRGTIGNESLIYYPISVGFNHNGHLLITDNHNTFNITIFDISGRVLKGYKSPIKHANCYNVALHPYRPQLVVTTKECQVLVFQYGDLEEGCQSSQLHFRTMKLGQGFDN